MSLWEFRKVASRLADINGSSVSDTNVVANHFIQFYSHIGSSVQESAKNDRENFLSEEFVDSW